MDNLTLSYLAGAIDSDGSIGIKRSTYHRRVRKDSSNPTYSERICLKQVTPQIPELLHDSFGGMLRQDKPSSSRNGKPLWSWQATDKKASSAIRQILPYLRVKIRQAEIALELRESKDSKYWKFAYWYEKEHPDWRQEELIDSEEVLSILNYKNVHSVSQAYRNGTILALPYDFAGMKKRYSKGCVVELLEHQQQSKDKRGRCRPKQLIAWRDRLCEEIRKLNKIGVHGTQVYRREGIFAAAS